MTVLKNEYWVIYRCAYRHNGISNTERSEITELYKKYGRYQIYNAVEKKKLVPAVAMLFLEMELDEEFWAPMIEKYRNRNKEVIECLNKMYCLFNQNNIKQIVVVENFAALLSSTQDIAMFGSGDIDEYAVLEEKEHIYSVLRSAGYRISEVRAGKILVSSSIRRDDFPDDFYFGINWDVTNRVNLPSFSANGDFIGWDKVRRYADTAIRLPSSDGLMYICLMHIAVHGFCKAPDIRLFYDIANAAEAKPNWDVIIEWSKRDGNCVKIAVAAYLAKKLLCVDIPEKVMNIGNTWQKKHLLDAVYCEADNRLRDFPNGIRRVLIDIYIEDRGVLFGLKNILFPNHKWIQRKYGSCVTGYIKHIIGLL